jgi:restriction system protein
VNVALVHDGQGKSMKFKMSEKTLFAMLLRSPWWISFLVSAVLGLVVAVLLPKPVAVVGVLFGFPFIVIGTMVAWRQRDAPSPAPVAHIGAAAMFCHDVWP